MNETKTRASSRLLDALNAERVTAPELQRTVTAVHELPEAHRHRRARWAYMRKIFPDQPLKIAAIDHRLVALVHVVDRDVMRTWVTSDPADEGTTLPAVLWEVAAVEPLLPGPELDFQFNENNFARRVLRMSPAGGQG